MAGLSFDLLGIIFLYLDMISTSSRMDHGEHLTQEPTIHEVILLGIGEITWMWFTMAFVYFFLSDRGADTMSACGIGAY